MTATYIRAQDPDVHHSLLHTHTHTHTNGWLTYKNSINLTLHQGNHAVVNKVALDVKLGTNAYAWIEKK